MLRNEQNDNKVTIDQIPDIIARAQYSRAEELSQANFGTSMRSWSDHAPLTIDDLPKLIANEELRRAYENDRR